MNGTLKIYHTFFSVISIHLCLWIVAVHAWMGYATVTEKPGLRYIIYLFQGLTKTEYSVYNFLIAFLGLQLIAFNVYYLVQKKPKHLMYTFAGVILLGIVIFIAEMIFNASFRSKV